MEGEGGSGRRLVVVVHRRPRGEGQDDAGAAAAAVPAWDAVRTEERERYGRTSWLADVWVEPHDPTVILIEVMVRKGAH